MFARIRPNQYPQLRIAHQSRLDQYPLMAAVVGGVQNGFVYSNAEGTVIFVGNRAGFALVSATREVPAPLYAELWQALQADPAIPSYLHLYDPPPTLSDYLTGRTSQHRIRRRAQFQLASRAPTFEYKNLLPNGYGIATIQGVGYNRLEDAFHLQFGERYWNSAEDFLARAIGVCISDENGAPVAISYSACIAAGTAEMDTLVLPEHRGRGFMRIVSEPFFNLALAAGLVSHWDTFVSNAPSYGLARKFKMLQVNEYDLLSIMLR